MVLFISLAGKVNLATHFPLPGYSSLPKIADSGKKGDKIQFWCVCVCVCVCVFKLLILVNGRVAIYQPEMEGEFPSGALVVFWGFLGHTVFLYS